MLPPTISQQVEAQVTGGVVVGFSRSEWWRSRSEWRQGRAVARRYRNRRIGEFLKELELSEGRGTGIPKILHALRTNASPEPVFETDDQRASFLVRLPVRPAPPETAQVTPQVAFHCREPRSAREIMAHLGLSHWKTFQANYLTPLIEDGLLERTIPDKPKSRLQKYRLTNAARAWLVTASQPAA